jgi:hypothetical protein
MKADPVSITPPALLPMVNFTSSSPLIILIFILIPAFESVPFCEISATRRARARRGRSVANQSWFLGCFVVQLIACFAKNIIRRYRVLLCFIVLDPAPIRLRLDAEPVCWVQAWWPCAGTQPRFK